jgi:hypothetical protein
MPTLGPNNMKFLISDQFATTTSAPDSLSTPMIVSGKDYTALYAIQDALTTLMQSAEVWPAAGLMDTEIG